MPTYEYQCSACGYEFEEFQKISDAPLETCPKCQQNSAKRIISATAFHLKGSGWYKTDYASSSSSSSKAATNSGDGEGKKNIEKPSEAAKESASTVSSTAETKPASEKVNKVKSE